MHIPDAICKKTFPTSGPHAQPAQQQPAQQQIGSRAGKGFINLSRERVVKTSARASGRRLVSPGNAGVHGMEQGCGEQQQGFQG